MKQPSEEQDPEFEKDLQRFSSPQACHEWLTQDLAHAEAFIEVTREKMQERGEDMSDEQWAELQALSRQMWGEIADEMIPLHYNPLVDRFLELIAQTSLSDEEEAEVKAMAPKLNRLIDMALDLAEPRRTEVMTTLTATQQELNKLLKYLED
ncbi:hypothetical protein [Prosthecobacter sp.]|jgi:hypothetical protein|uniref:hypothetical protein n=1 Tax=Prosthecobacter sp. TaxID=1965333 RepID=UPI003784980D